MRHPRRKSDQRFDEATNLWIFHVCDRDLTVGDRVGADHVVVVKSQALRIPHMRIVKRDTPAPAGIEIDVHKFKSCNLCTQSAIRECISV